ncbi:YhcN/YlaJ family sporulation lipoprotein [Halobacillus sp. A1]|uniref:YhcN/YlaJ family sporulation lipoprotein n=1 Tax=Halobacillus sp. A1 TaxID=2880262 RepID=UPI0020A64378|nr:YhcN/YlaJ family sporulation lipoprotein [Halobacillus sp. A1]MCP3030439.1 YhcN/YlaJ family sporulation lipoprotein [Halobacillus sp. A1]
MWKILIVILLAAVLSACKDDIPEKTNESQSDELYQPIEYTDEDKKPKGTQIPTGEDQFFKRSTQEEMRETKYSETTRSHDNAFNNEEAMLITQEVNELKEVTLSQAFTNGEKAYVAVMVNPHDYKDEKIAEKVLEKAEAVTDLPVVVYTNVSQWDRRKDEDARSRAAEAPEALKKQIKDFFNSN